MRGARRAALGLALVLAVALALPPAAQAHAYLIRTTPPASGILDAPPRQVALRFDEAVEPRLAIVSVTDAGGSQETSGPVARSPTDPDTLEVALRAGLPEGWYLVYWRAISVDGHPVQGAFTYAVGPNPGPAPLFQVPMISATATTPGLLLARWAMFLFALLAGGLFALRTGVARSTVRRLPGASLRTLTAAFSVCAGLALFLIPVYLDLAMADDSLRSPLDLASVVPLFRATAFGRGYEDFWLLFALFTVAAAITLALDRPERPRRSLAEILALTGAVLAGAGALFVPGAIGHAGQTSPRGLSIALDALHLLAGAIWLGGLAGLLALWLSLSDQPPPGTPSRLQVLQHVVPRFSRVALGSVILLLATGTAATVVHMPAVDALWLTGYGQAILVKLALLAAAAALGAVNLLRTTPSLAAAHPRDGAPHPSARLLRRTVSGEVALVTGAVFAAAVLSSLAPPPPAFALQDRALARVGPGQVAATVHEGAYTLQVLVAPNRAAAPDRFALRITRDGQPVTGATVTLTFNHLEMQMPQQQYALSEVRPGLYSRAAPALIMAGQWGLGFRVAPRGAPAFQAFVVDQADG